MRPRRLRFLPPSALALTLALAAGCEEPRHVGGARPAPAPQPEAPKEDTFIVGQRTSEIVNAEPELKKGAEVASTKIVARDPITLPGNAYVTIIGRSSMLLIDQAMNLYKAENDRYPKDFEEFQTAIVKPNNIALPRLPYYQKYGYDEKEHKLVILEYPELKNQPLRR